MSPSAIAAPRGTARIHRIALAAVLIALAAVTSFSMAGCSLFDPSQAIAQGLSQKLDAIKNPSEADLRQSMGDSSVDELKKAGVDPVAFCKALFTHYEYQIKDVTMDGDNAATVSMHVKSIDLTNLTANLVTDMLADAFSNPSKYANMDDTASSKIAYEKMQEKASAPDAKTVESDVTVTVKKGSDGQWTIPSDTDRFKVLFGDQAASKLFGAAESSTGSSSSNS